MLKKGIIAVGITFVLALVVFGWERTSSYLAGARQVVNDEVDNGSPMNLEFLQGLMARFPL